MSDTASIHFDATKDAEGDIDKEALGIALEAPLAAVSQVLADFDFAKPGQTTRFAINDETVREGTGDDFDPVVPS